MDDALIFILAAALGITGLITIVGAITDAREKREARRMRAKHAEAVRMGRLRRSIVGNIPDVTSEEYDDAVQVLIRKYHMGDRDGGLALDDDTLPLAADRMTDTILQARLTRAMLDTAELNPKLENQGTEGWLHSAS